MAKTTKARERIEAAGSQPARVLDKDALDLLRLLQTTATVTFANTIEAIPQDSPAWSDTLRMLEDLRTLGSRPDDPLPLMAQTASGDDPISAAAFAALTNDLLDVLPWTK